MGAGRLKLLSWGAAGDFTIPDNSEACEASLDVGDGIAPGRGMSLPRGKGQLASLGVSELRARSF